MPSSETSSLEEMLTSFLNNEKPPDEMKSQQSGGQMRVSVNSLEKSLKNFLKDEKIPNENPYGYTLDIKPFIDTISCAEENHGVFEGSGSDPCFGSDENHDVNIKQEGIKEEIGSNIQQNVMPLSVCKKRKIDENIAQEQETQTKKSPKNDPEIMVERMKKANERHRHIKQAMLGQLKKYMDECTKLRIDLDSKDNLLMAEKRKVAGLEKHIVSLKELCTTNNKYEEVSRENQKIASAYQKLAIELSGKESRLKEHEKELENKDLLIASKDENLKSKDDENARLMKENAELQKNLENAKLKISSFESLLIELRTLNAKCEKTLGHKVALSDDIKIEKRSESPEYVTDTEDN
eukprot:TRINITY_DN12764_c0_g1_i3.p1 TRINITY_DN12764_c0_g1~~TRINITY_DN12764_c0_g1_i3.p1  ORF type:complete len:351 (+),score=89.59 TRINITY_DN12764_c0_g1_i3:46-1098(+)